MSWIDPLGLAYKGPGEYGHGQVEVLSGAKIHGWIADLPGADIVSDVDDEVAQGLGCDIPKNADVDFINVNGNWYKIKNGKAYVDVDENGVSVVLPCRNCQSYPSSIYRIDRAPPVWRAADGNKPENYVNDRSDVHANETGSGLPNTPVPVPTWKGIRYYLDI